MLMASVAEPVGADTFWSEPDKTEEILNDTYRYSLHSFPHL